MCTGYHVGVLTVVPHALCGPGNQEVFHVIHGLISHVVNIGRYSREYGLVQSLLTVRQSKPPVYWMRHVRAESGAFPGSPSHASPHNCYREIILIASVTVGALMLGGLVAFACVTSRRTKAASARKGEAMFGGIAIALVSKAW